MKNQNYQLSQALEVKLWNLEDVSEEREMIGSIVLDRQSANPWEVITFLQEGCYPSRIPHLPLALKHIRIKTFFHNTIEKRRT
jgi:hypothetical protein